MRVFTECRWLILCVLAVAVGRGTAQTMMMQEPELAASPATVAAQTITPKSIYVHLGQNQTFVSAGATVWTATEGSITHGLFVAPTAMPKSATVTVAATGPGGTATATVTLVGGALQAASPATVTMNLGAKQQFTSAGALGWSAVFGTITSTGLYTAPAVYPNYGTDTITVTGTHGSARAAVTLNVPVPVITRVGTGGQLPLGLFTVTVSGTGFAGISEAWLNKIPLNTTYSNGELTITGYSGIAGPGNVTVVNHTLVSPAFPVTVGVAKPKVTAAAARRFLEQAAFGPSPTDAEYLQTIGFQGWLNEQFKLTFVSNYNSAGTTYDGLPTHFITNAVNNPDQLRQRVAFALSQIFVTSLDKGTTQNMISYQNMLLNDAFTNYRQIMADVTLSPAMGQYLDMANNAKADPVAGSVANENYARELMQLFTIGTNMLNPDGTLQYDSNGLTIPTYTQFTVTEFARVYTGWTYRQGPGVSTQWDAGVTSYTPMAPYAAQHDSGSKQLLNGYVAPAGTIPLQDLNNAMDNIFKHTNVGPFVSKQLIQHLVKSNPSPAYVARVAAVFKNNGSNVRGDMKSVITAILMDPEARANDVGGADQPTDGHLQEPALFIPGMLRAFGATVNNQNYYAWEMAQMGQDVFSPASVFNYYAPNTGAPGTALTGGEFGIYSPNSAVLRANLVSDLFSQWSSTVQTYGPGTSLNVAGYLTVASSPVTLVNALDLTLTHGTMPEEMKAPIVTAVTGETGGSLRRVQRAIYLILTSEYYNVWH